MLLLCAVKILYGWATDRASFFQFPFSGGFVFLKLVLCLARAVLFAPGPWWHCVLIGFALEGRGRRSQFSSRAIYSAQTCDLLFCGCSVLAHHLGPHPASLKNSRFSSATW